MYPRRILALSDDERAALLYHRDHDPKPFVRERCAALLKIQWSALVRPQP